MPKIDDYVARIEGTCGAEKDVVVVLKFDNKDEATAKIKQRAQLTKSLAGMISDFSFQDVSFRLYSSGKIIFKGVKNKQELNKLLAGLLL
jgi:hypothetical protein